MNRHPNRCLHCGILFEDISEKLNHERSHAYISIAVRTCKLCKTDFPCLLDLLLHEERSHGGSSKGGIQIQESLEAAQEFRICSECREEFPRMLDLILHLDSIHPSASLDDPEGTKVSK